MKFILIKLNLKEFSKRKANKSQELKFTILEEITTLLIYITTSQENL